MKVDCRDMGPIAGLEDIASNLQAEIDDGNVERIATSIAAAGVPIPQTMGIWSGFKDLIEWVRGRRFVRDLPVTTVAIPWFAVHVPHAGTAQVKITETQSDTTSVAFRLFGTGWIRGRSLALEITSEASPRDVCASYYVDVSVQPKVYVFDDRESVAIDILGEAGSRSVALELCPFCSVAPENLDQFEHVLEPFLDLREDRVKHQRTVKLNWTDEGSIGIDATIPGTELSISLNTALSTAATWQVNYEFVPGALYQPYRHISDQRYLPPMWAYSKKSD